MPLTEERRRELLSQMATNPELRREIKILTANKRSIVAKKERTTRASPFPEDVFTAAARSIADGMTVPAIARSIWSEYGYASQVMAEQALRNGLRKRGLMAPAGSARLA